MKLLVCVLAAAIVATQAQDNGAMFSSWSASFGKTYPNAFARQHAFANFEASLERIALQNAEANGETTFGLNQFSDLSPAEFAAQYLTLKTSDVAETLKHSQEHLPSAEELAAREAPMDKIDWRDSGAVTNVKDQGQCGSCWAFSVTEETESMYFLKSKSLVELAPEQLVDCDKKDSGCNGGITEWAFNYLAQAGGMMAEKDYPYTAGKSGKAGSCKFVKDKIVAPVRNMTWVVKPCMYVGEKCDNQDENAIKAALLKVGPFSVCVNAAWQDYKSGVFTKNCPHAAGNINHAVQLVGFNSDAPTPYWIVRNSWGPSWGEKGYIFLKQGGNQCGVANLVIYPTIA